MKCTTKNMRFSRPAVFHCRPLFMRQVSRLFPASIRMDGDKRNSLDHFCSQGSPLYIYCSYFPAYSRHRNVTIWALVRPPSGLKMEFVEPLIMPPVMPVSGPFHGFVVIRSGGHIPEKTNLHFLRECSLDLHPSGGHDEGEFAVALIGQRKFLSVLSNTLRLGRTCG